MSGGMVLRKTCYNFPFSGAKLRIFSEPSKFLRTNFFFINKSSRENGYKWYFGSC